MLHDFLTSHRQELIARCRDKVARRFQPVRIPDAVDHGVPLFLEQLTETLRAEQSTAARDKPDSELGGSSSEIGRAAAVHGADLLRLGYRVDQVVRDYGDVCQSITDLAVVRRELITTDEFRTLNRCLDDAIAGAVSSFATADAVLANDDASSQNQLKCFLEEYNRLVSIAINSYDAIRTGSIGVAGATGALLIFALGELRTLPARTYPGMPVEEISATAGRPN